MIKYKLILNNLLGIIKRNQDFNLKMLLNLKILIIKEDVYTAVQLM